MAVKNGHQSQFMFGPWLLVMSAQKYYKCTATKFKKINPLVIEIYFSTRF